MERQKPTRDFEAFLDHLEASATRPFDLPSDQRELYFRLVKGSIFATFAALGREVGKIGKPVFSHQTIDQGRAEAEWLSVYVQAPITPEPLVMGGQEVGRVISRFYVTDPVNTVSFSTLDNGEVVVANENVEGSERILNNIDLLFDPLPSHVLYPAGNPAAWINKVVEREMLDKMKKELLAIKLQTLKDKYQQPSPEDQPAQPR